LGRGHERGSDPASPALVLGLVGSSGGEEVSTRSWGASVLLERTRLCITPCLELSRNSVKCCRGRAACALQNQPWGVDVNGGCAVNILRADADRTWPLSPKRRRPGARSQARARIGSRTKQAPSSCQSAFKNATR